MARLVSVNVARAQTFTVGEKKFRSAILKAPVDASARVELRELGLEGDQQADRRFHGGPEKAVYLYSFEHYDFWRRVLKLDSKDRLPMPPGTFGENLTIGGFERDLEHDLHVGDVLEIGPAVDRASNGVGSPQNSRLARLQLTTPRQPCWKLETRMGLVGFAKSFLESGRIGMYARVVQPGAIGVDDEVRVVERAARAASIADLILALYFEDRDASERVLADPNLDAKLRRRIERRTRRSGDAEDADDAERDEG